MNLNKTLTWNHTRKDTPMKMTGPYGKLILQVMAIRYVYPNYPMFIDGKPV
jgi:hypothetical protein